MLISKNTPDNKAYLRKQTIKKITELSADILAERGRMIEDRVIATEWFKQSKSIFLYVSSAWEVSTHHLIRRGLMEQKQVFVPRVRAKGEMDVCQLKDFSEDLKKGTYAILEPKVECALLESCAEIDLLVVPGVAFTPQGLRLGRGGGYFDRFLAKENKGNVLGLAYEVQICVDLPREDHDQSVGAVMTESHFYRS